MIFKICRLIVALIIGFWVTTLNVWAFPLIMEHVGVESPSFITIIWAFGIICIDVVLAGWALGLFDQEYNSELKGGKDNAKEKRK